MTKLSVPSAGSLQYTHHKFDSHQDNSKVGLVGLLFGDVESSAAAASGTIVTVLDLRPSFLIPH